MLNPLRAGQLMKPHHIQLGRLLRRFAAIAGRSETAANGGTAAIESIKLYGERNTGTRFLHDLLAANLRAPSLSGSFGASASRSERAIARSMLKEQRQLLRILVEDKLLTLHHPDHIAKTFGWKHASPPVDYLRGVPERASRTLFIVLVKHPVYWAVSFHKRPYHTYFPSTRGLPFHEFLHHIFIPSGRDNVQAALYPSAIELYAAKVDGYRRLAELGFPFELIRYEDLLRDVPGALDRLATKYGLARRHADWIVRSGSTKESGMSLENYREKYRLDKLRNIVPPEDYDFIIQSFGSRRLEWLGYEKD